MKDMYLFSPDIKRPEKGSIWSLTDNDLDLKKNLKVGSKEQLERLASRGGGERVSLLNW